MVLVMTVSYLGFDQMFLIIVGLQNCCASRNRITARPVQSGAWESSFEAL